MLSHYTCVLALLTPPTFNGIIWDPPSPNHSTGGQYREGCFLHSVWEYTVTYFEITRSTVHASLWTVCTFLTQANSRIRLAEVGGNAEIQDCTHQPSSALKGNNSGHKKIESMDSKENWNNWCSWGVCGISQFCRLRLCPDPLRNRWGLLMNSASCILLVCYFGIK